MVQDGDRIQKLVSGGRWLWGTAECSEGGLWFVSVGGQRWRIYDARWLKVRQLNLFEAAVVEPQGSNPEPNIVPMPELECSFHTSQHSIYFVKIGASAPLLSLPPLIAKSNLAGVSRRIR